jgi:hypothetical protein
MSVGQRSSSHAAEPRQEGALDQRGSGAERSLSWSALSEGTVPLLDDLERVEADEKEARWRVVTGARPKSGASRHPLGITRSGSA